MTDADAQSRERRPDPSPPQITAATAVIRAGWSEREHRSRAGIPNGELPRVEIKTVAAIPE